MGRPLRNPLYKNTTKITEGSRYDLPLYTHLRGRLILGRSNAGPCVDGLAFDDEGLTIEVYLERWLNDSVRDTLRTSTYERNQTLVGLHVVLALGRLELKSLTPAHVRWFYRQKPDASFSAATVHKMHVVLHKALDQAVRDRSFAPLLKRTNLRKIRFRDLRHTCATLLLGRNINPKIVSEMLECPSISITLDTYSHVLPDMQDSAARALEEALR